MATVLLVEDDDAVRKLLQHMLRKSGYIVLAAGSVSDALAAAGRHEGTIDLLVTDVVMPRSSCNRLVERLRADRPEVRTLYISGYSEDMLDRYGVDHSKPNFLRKPFTAEMLARKVDEVLGGGRRALGAGAGPEG